jgi:hypothetical protein
MQAVLNKEEEEVDKPQLTGDGAYLGADSRLGCAQGPVEVRAASTRPTLSNPHLTSLYYLSPPTLFSPSLRQFDQSCHSRSPFALIRLFTWPCSRWICGETSSRGYCWPPVAAAIVRYHAISYTTAQRKPRQVRRSCSAIQLCCRPSPPTCSRSWSLLLLCTRLPGSTIGAALGR